MTPSQECHNIEMLTTHVCDWQGQTRPTFPLGESKTVETRKYDYACVFGSASPKRKSRPKTVNYIEVSQHYSWFFNSPIYKSYGFYNSHD
jgi:hypothetical protein